MKMKTCVWGALFGFLLVGVGLFPFQVGAKTPRTQPSSQPATQAAKALPTKAKAVPSKRRKVSTSRPVALRSKPTSKPTSKPKKEAVTVRCRGRVRYGSYCVGRFIGPKVGFRSIRCPLGGRPFTVRTLKGLKAKKRDCDLRPHLGRFGQADYVWICPDTGYAAFPEDFHKPFDKQKMLRALKPIRRTFNKTSDVPAWYRYQAAAASYWARGKDARFFGRLFLRAMWAARETKARGAERRFRMRAIAAMHLAIRKRLYPVRKIPTVAYLIAELYRQASRWKESIYWFDRAMIMTLNLQKRSNLDGRVIRRMITQGRLRTVQKDSRIYILP